MGFAGGGPPLKPLAHHPVCMWPLRWPWLRHGIPKTYDLGRGHPLGEDQSGLFGLRPGTSRRTC